MSVIFLSCSPIESLSREPYITFTKKYKRIEENLDGKRIEIYLSSKQEGVSEGFYSDDVFIHDPSVQFVFASIKPGESIDEGSTFVRMSFSFDCNEDNYHFYKPRIQALKNVQNTFTFLWSLILDIKHTWTKDSQ